MFLGLSRFGGKDVRASARFEAAVNQLPSCQDGRDGAWLLRQGDLKDPLFAFYPSLLFVDPYRTRDWRDLAERVLAHTRSPLTTALLGNVTLVDKVLAAHVIDRVDKVLPAAEPDRRAFERRRTSLLNSLVDHTGRPGRLRRRMGIPLIRLWQ